ncbi:aminoglycoside phosphotransferase family protein [Promicromonospora sukumoe]|uniref:Streptomycin 6-kinase n=1 Tax=Promicromonospora sukumoe TaxID=88382 RepID=A0A7W3J9T5_9MICO|nr:aminoglycoside phosphotransferase family protein [Promicromonospora sukumoe]MBA8808925.1 streptomycin 6-kinase [Promicromonospora sukumoe]
MSSAPAIEVPAALAASYARSFGDEGQAWIAGLPGLVADLLERWDLRRDGATSSGEASLVVPVVGSDGVRAVLKLQLPRAETAAALTGLRAWDGHGMVRLLDHDPGSGTMLLERLDGARTLAAVEDDTRATQILAELHARLLVVPPPPGLPHLRDVAAAMLEQVPRAVKRLADPADRRLLQDWAAVVAELAGEPGDRMLHWDLHYDNVLAAEREPWLAIDPEPLVGDPGFDLWPALDSRWDDVVAGGDPRRMVRRRFDVLTEVLGLDREQAAGWTLGRLLQNALWDIEDGQRALAPAAVVVAEAVRR